MSKNQSFLTLALFFFFQFIGVFAFAALCAYAGALKLTLNCYGVKQGVYLETYYPFSEYSYYKNKQPVCNDSSLDGKGTLMLTESFQGESQFFVFVGVISFLFCLVMIAVYVYVEDQEEEASSTNVGKCSIPVVVSQNSPHLASLTLNYLHPGF